MYYQYLQGDASPPRFSFSGTVHMPIGLAGTVVRSVASALGSGSNAILQDRVTRGRLSGQSLGAVPHLSKSRVAGGNRFRFYRMARSVVCGPGRSKKSRPSSKLAADPSMKPDERITSAYDGQRQIGSGNRTNAINIVASAGERARERGYRRAERRASQIADGDIGISSCVTPRSESAWMIALAAAGSAPDTPDSPAPFTPSGLVVHGTT